MPGKLHIANLNCTTTDRDLERLFAGHGTVRSARVTTAAASDRSAGSGIVEMGTDDEGDAAIVALDGRPFRGHPLFVNWATTRNETDAAHSSLFGPMNMTADAPSHPAHCPGAG
jgi:RNA recognition motif-containing protein